MEDTKYNWTKDTAWCPGCGNFAILDSVKQALIELELEQEKICFVSGIGQAAKLPQYLKVSYFNGLHGRTLPVATAIKLANPELKVIINSGDGCSYGEGGNHFIHAIRKNVNVTMFVHNNQIYGLTKGQTSPTTLRGQETTSHVRGAPIDPFNPLAVAISLGATFVARTFSGYKDETKTIMKKAIEHEGFALVDIFQPCVSFNKVNTFSWYKENTYWIDDSHDKSNKLKALDLALKEDKYPIGIFYIDKSKKPLEQNIDGYKEFSEPLFKRELSKSKLKKLIRSRK